MAYNNRLAVSVVSYMTIGPHLPRLDRTTLTFLTWVKVIVWYDFLILNKYSYGWINHMNQSWANFPSHFAVLLGMVGIVWVQPDMAIYNLVGRGKNYSLFRPTWLASRILNNRRVCPVLAGYWWEYRLNIFQVGSIRQICVGRTCQANLIFDRSETKVDPYRV